MYGNVSELRKYAGKKQLSVTCKSCRSSRSPMYSRMCTFRGYNFPDIIPVLSRHPGCADQYQEDIEEWGHYPHLPEKTRQTRKKGNSSKAKK